MKEYTMYRFTGKPSEFDYGTHGLAKRKGTLLEMNEEMNEYAANGWTVHSFNMTEDHSPCANGFTVVVLFERDI